MLEQELTALLRHGEFPDQTRVFQQSFPWMLEWPDTVLEADFPDTI